MKNKLLKFFKGFTVFMTIVGVLFSNIPFNSLSFLIDSYENTSSIVDKIWLVQKENNPDVVDKFVSLRDIAKKIKIQETRAAEIAQYTGGLLVYADTVNAGTPKYKTFDDTAGFGVEQNASSVGASAINWIRVAASPTNNEWIIATRDAANVIKAQVCTGIDGGVSCGTPTQITATAGTHGFRNFDVAYEQTSGDALLVYGTATADELRKIELVGGSWINDAAITTTRTTGTVEWVELTSRPANNQIGIAYSDTNDDVSAYRWNGTAAADEATAVITATAVTGDVRKFDISFEGTSGDMLVAAPLAGAGTTATGQLVGTTWTIGTQTAPDNVTAFIDLQETNTGDDDIAMIAHGTTAAGANTMEGYEWSGTGVVDGTVAVDTSALNWLANYHMAATAYVNTTYYAAAVFSDTTGADDINWWTMNNAGTWVAQADNLRTRGNIGFIDLFDYPNMNKVLLLSSDSNSDLWADTWDGTTPSSTIWVDRTSGGALETSLSIATKDVVDFAFRLAPVPTATLATGSDPGAGIVIAPGAAATDVDLFTLQTNSGTETVTSVTVNLSTNNGVGTLAITDNTNTVLGSIGGGTGSGIVTGSNAISVSGMSAVSGSATTFKVRVTPLSHANMAVPDGADYSITAPVTSWVGTGGYTHVGSDTNPNALTVDNNSPAGTTGAGATSGENAQSVVSWTNPGDTDFQQVYVYCKTSSLLSGEAPTEGADPAAGATCDGTARLRYKGAASPQTITGLTNGQIYYFRIYARDTNGNFTAYSATQEVTGTPSAPANITSISNFVTAEPGNSTIAPGASGLVDSFGFQTDGGTDTVTAATVTLAAGTGSRIATVAITNDGDTVTYCSAAPSGDSASLSTCGIPVSTTNTQFKIKITAISHASMPAPPGGSYAVTATVTGFTSTNSQSGSDSGSSTLTIDNASPNGATSVSGSAGDAANTINWTTSNSSDFNTTSGSVILRWASGSAGSEVPAEGSTYTAGDPITTATVACVISSAASAAQSKVDGAGGSAGCTTTALTNGQAYTYKAFQKDTNGNYDVGVLIGTFTPTAPTVTVGVTAGAKVANVNSGDTYQYANTTSCSSAADCAAFTFLLNSGSGTLTSVKITETGTVNAVNDLSNIALFYDTDGNFSNGVTGQYGATTTSFTTETATISGSLGITSGTTYYFYVRYFASSTAPTYPAGGQTVNFQIAANGDLTLTGGPIVTGAPQSLAGVTTVKPKITNYINSTETGLNYATSCSNCGARIGGGSGFRQTVAISGYGFGADPGLGSRDTATNKVEVVGGATTVLTDDASANTNVSAWSNTSITIRTDTNISGNDDTSWGANFGGASALKVTAGGQAVPTNLNFYIFPQVTSLTVCDKAGFPVGDNAREYDATDSACPNGLTDGQIKLNGTRFGTASTGGYVRVLGCDASTCSSPTGTVNIDSWSNTLIQAQIPTIIANNSYTGSLAMQQGTGSNNKTHTYTSTGFRVLPRITGFTPSSDSEGAAVIVDGNHFCQNNGSCPTVFGVNDKVTFYNTTDATTFTSWTDTAMSTAVPTGAVTGDVVLKSNTYNSNGKSFTVLSNVPANPASLNQYKDSGLTQTISVGGTASATPIYLKQTMEVSGISGGTLYPQFEYKLTGVAFVCGAGACGSATEGIGWAGPGPTTGTTSISVADGDYHWQARTRHNKNSIDYYSSWVSFGGNADPGDLDFKIDTVGPTITNISSGTPGSNSATITWDTTGELSTSQLQYNLTGTFVNDCATNNDCTTLADTPPETNGKMANHSVSLSNLSSGTTYYYRVRSKGADGNETISANNTFATQSVTQPGKTTRFHISGFTAKIDPATASTTTFTIDMPENATSTKSAYVEITGVSDATGVNPSGITIQFNSENSVNYVAPTGNAFKTDLKIIHKINSVNVSPATNTLTITTDTYTNFYISSANIYVTYGYTP